MAAEPLELDDDRSRCAICLAVELDDPTALFGLAPTDGQPEAGSDGAAEAVDHAPRVDETDDTDREEQGTVTGAPTDLPSCPHRFCRGCIEGWAAYAHVCPTCKAPFERLGSSVDPGDVDGSLPTAPITAAPAVTHHPGEGDAPTGGDLMGLDHTYFLAEMERVASGLGSMIGAFQRKGHHAMSVWDMDMLGELASYSSLMDDLMGSVVSGELFDPAELMRQLYDVEGALQRARLGPEAEPIAEAPRIYSGYDDDVVSDGSGGGYYHDGYYDDPYDEYYDDRW